MGLSGFPSYASMYLHILLGLSYVLSVLFFSYKQLLMIFFRHYLYITYTTRGLHSVFSYDGVYGVYIGDGFRDSSVVLCLRCKIALTMLFCLGVFLEGIQMYLLLIHL